MPAYDFSVDSIFTNDPFKDHDTKETVSYVKPKDYATIVTEPKNFFDFDDYQKTLQ